MNFNKNNKLFLLFFYVLIEFAFSMLRGPMPQTKEIEGRPQFWSFNQQQQHFPLPTTTEKTKQSEDYYDAINEEDEFKQKQPTKNQDDETASAIHLMTVLQSNVNPLFPILPSGKLNKEKIVVDNDTSDNDFKTKKNNKEVGDEPIIVLLPDFEVERSSENIPKKQGFILVDEATNNNNK